ncbi:MAG: hypothetical protein O3B76_02245 [Proteobacteria bacterium]|nr:hypothetical protein [Pseudomonadota bacterium]MDA1022483.1 hypothetical protein [Pseudomonadota bacterium]
MLYQFQHSIMEIWSSWCGLFTFIPYGDPYIAFAVLCVLLAMSARILAGRDHA